MVTKPRMISLRLTEDQYQSIQEMIKFIEVETGTKVTQSSLILKLIEFGRPILKDLYPRTVRPRVLVADLREAELPKKRFRFFR